MENVLTTSTAALPSKREWLIRLSGGCALIWQRKFLLGFIPVPWMLSGGTYVIRTPDMGDVLIRAKEHIYEQAPNAWIKVQKVK